MRDIRALKLLLVNLENAELLLTRSLQVPTVRGVDKSSLREDLLSMYDIKLETEFIEHQNEMYRVEYASVPFFTMADLKGDMEELSSEGLEWVSIHDVEVSGFLKSVLAQIKTARENSYARMTLKDAQKLFGVTSRELGDPKALKSKWRELARSAHPDVGGSDEQMKKVNEAYTILLKHSESVDSSEFTQAPREAKRSAPQQAPRQEARSSSRAKSKPSEPYTPKKPKGDRVKITLSGREFLNEEKPDRNIFGVWYEVAKSKDGVPFTDRLWAVLGTDIDSGFFKVYSSSDPFINMPTTKSRIVVTEQGKSYERFLKLYVDTSRNPIATEFLRICKYPNGVVLTEAILDLMYDELIDGDLKIVEDVLELGSDDRFFGMSEEDIEFELQKDKRQKESEIVEIEVLLKEMESSLEEVLDASEGDEELEERLDILYGEISKLLSRLRRGELSSRSDILEIRKFRSMVEDKSSEVADLVEAIRSL